jgi:hypothetical protein
VTSAFAAKSMLIGLCAFSTSLAAQSLTGELLQLRDVCLSAPAVATGDRAPSGSKRPVYRDQTLADGNLVRIVVVPDNSGRRILELHAQAEPATKKRRRAVLSIAFDAACSPVEARKLDYDPGGAAFRLVLMDKALTPQGEIPINPVVPGGRPQSRWVVALVDSGVNYLLPEIDSHLARDSSGHLIGFDFDEGDNRPFDADPRPHGPFYPIHHGTSVASVLLAASGGRVAIAPFIAPRRLNENALKALFDAIAANKIRVVNLSIGSNENRTQGYWKVVAAEVARHPEIIVVAAAGNDATDIDRYSEHSDLRKLDNVIVVGSATSGGQMSRSSNYGHAVDVAVVADPIQGIDFNGNPRMLQGTSFAAPVVSAIVAGMLDKDPAMRADQIKAALCNMSKPLKGDKATRCGYLPSYK